MKPMLAALALAVAVAPAFAQTTPAAPPARAPIVPSPPQGPLAASLADIKQACDSPVLMVVDGDLSAIGFRPPADGSPGYGAQLRASGLYERFNGFYLLSGAPSEVFEGVFDPARHMALVAEFPCAAAARAWYWSADYTRIKALRKDAGSFRVAIWPKRTFEQMNWVRERAAKAAAGGN